MEPPKKKRISPVWEHFDLISPDKVKCLLCAKELGYNNTSSMPRHYRAMHENKDTEAGLRPAERNELDEALVSMVIGDTQPFSIVEDQGFRKFVKALNPTCVLPTRKALKAMVEAKYRDWKDKAKASVEKAAAVSLTSDMWTSINTDAYLAITCHFVDDNSSLNSVLLGVQHFPQAYTVDNIARVTASLMEEWAISHKVTCLVTDGAANMRASARELRLRHTICVAHTLNLMVKKALDQTPVLSDIRAKSRRIVGYFRSSTTAKERLAVVQEQMGRPKLKLIQEVETRWNSTDHMLQRLFALREPVGAVLASLSTDLSPLTSEKYNTIAGCLQVLAPFNHATVELSEEQRVPSSKVIPLLSMLDHSLEEEMAKPPSNAKLLAEQLRRHVRERLQILETRSVMSLATVLDPRS